MLVKDQLNRELYFPRPPKRIISLVPSQTELLVHLGLKELLVGITKFCVHPKKLRKEIPTIGGTKNVHLDKIKELQPDIIICNREENTKEIVYSCENIAPVWVSDISTIDHSLEMICSFGNIFEVIEASSKLVKAISAELQDFKKWMVKKPLKKVVYLIWKEPYMAAGKDTFINELLAINKFQNIIFESRYPEINPELFDEADLILLSSEPFPFKQKHIEEIQQETNSKVMLVDGEYFSWYGSRLEEAFSYFKTLHL